MTDLDSSPLSTQELVNDAFAHPDKYADKIILVIVTEATRTWRFGRHTTTQERAIKFGSNGYFLLDTQRYGMDGKFGKKVVPASIGQLKGETDGPYEAAGAMSVLKQSMREALLS
jgi:hypothetical protein